MIAIISWAPYRHDVDDILLLCGELQSATSRSLAVNTGRGSRPRRERCRVVRTQVKCAYSRPASALCSAGRLVLIQFVSVGGMRTGPVPGGVPCCFRASSGASRRISAHFPASSRAAPAQGSSLMHPMLNIAVKAARRAAQIINRASLDLDLLQVSKKQHNDFVTEVDKASEAAIIDTLKTAYPDHAILAEESGKSDNDSEYQWIIDPLDGTTNFIHGFPYYCVSIALAHKCIVTQAVVYDPTRNDLYTASRGRGAFLNDRRIRVAKRDRLADGLIGTGFPFRETDGLEAYGRQFAEMTQACAGLRRPGAAALDLANVAAGRMDGFFEQGLNAWDVAAGSLLITEAGGLVGNYTGDSEFLHVGEVVAGNPKIYAQMIPVLSRYSRTRQQAA
jgi:myo-inositol-1(or 4)-monophosphatase